MVLLVNPEYLLSLTDIQAATRLWHETQHILRDSFERLSEYIESAGDKVNEAQDLAINGSGDEGPWDFGPDGLLPSQHGFPNGLSCEEYFNLLTNQPKQPSPKQKWGGCHGCGSATGKSPNKELEDRVDRELGRSPQERQNIEKQTARDILLMQDKIPGNMSGMWTEWAKARLEPPKVPWNQKLANLTRYCLATFTPGGGIDYSYQHPARRSYIGPQGVPSFLYPGPVDPVSEVAVVLDTSASMNLDVEIAIALRETKGVIDANGQRDCWYLEVDTEEAAAARRITPPELLKLQIHGRGGTDFRPAFAAIEKLNPRPSVLVYMTDGYGPAPEKKPKDLEVIWCLVGRTTHVPAAWGHVVHAKD
jgi:predicted metal-dependent peptidase